MHSARMLRSVGKNTTDCPILSYNLSIIIIDIFSRDDGIVSGTMLDKVAKLFGPTTILGRSMVVSAGGDSTAARLACGEIEATQLSAGQLEATGRKPAPSADVREAAEAAIRQAMDEAGVVRKSELRRILTPTESS